MSNCRPYRGLLKLDLARKAEAAARVGDDVTFDACLDELRERKRADDLIEELLDFRAESHGRRSLPPIAQAISANQLSELSVITDDDCWSRGLELVRRARRSTWLSTFTLKDSTEELRETLTARVRANVAVSLLVSNSRANGGARTQDLVADLRQAGVTVFERPNHSKCIVVDGEYVLVGSANLQSMHWGDLCIQFRSSSIAQVITAVLEGIARS